MKETEPLGKLLPGHPDVRPIIENIRGKYGIPEVRPEMTIFTQVIRGLNRFSSCKSDD